MDFDLPIGVVFNDIIEKIRVGKLAPTRGENQKSNLLMSGGDAEPLTPVKEKNAKKKTGKSHVKGTRSSARLLTKGKHDTEAGVVIREAQINDIATTSSSSEDDADDVTMEEAMLLKHVYFGPREDGSASVKALPKSSSDHTPILLTSKVFLGSIIPFHFKIGWLKENDILDLIKSTWENTIVSGSLDFQLHKKLLNIKHKLMDWKKEKFYSIKGKVDEVLLSIETTDQVMQQMSSWTTEMDGERRAKLNELQELRRVEEVRRQNDISGLAVDGVDTDDGEGMSHAIINYFHRAFTSEVSCTPRLSRVGFKVLPPHLSSILDRDVSLEELKKTVFALPGDKAPGPDGFPLIFFHQFWNLISSELLEMIRRFLRSGNLFKGFNSTFIALIPKKSMIAALRNIRPISLLTSLYKIVAKVLAEQLKKVLPVIISGPQLAFIKDNDI
ncbi:uncharacterized protein LOC105420097 [Amborella trichopoda]|uniref:uncharacterized protein LOC105420097 n=1 Tax=Amborella trichopoda TaxID=13333 RepID=UPI0005D38F15|nr:uncharacterized protein LOC105420097 [Amborella trichopoda]|eukprot:XP_011620659.1 uncharacterized protein LOC105420097 [Amborella trichopoda]